MRRILIPLALAAGTLVPLATPSAAAEPTCFGEPATIVGTPGEITFGTQGDDVIITEGSFQVYAGDGDDLVCATAEEDGVRTNLGDGNDRYLGGPWPDFVNSSDRTDAASGDDIVMTGAGRDRVLASHGSSLVATDRLLLGAGNDELALMDTGLTPAARVNGGTGRDTIDVNPVDEGYDNVIDTRAHTMTRRGTGFLHSWTSFETYEIQAYRGSVTFGGSDASERLWVEARTVDVAMGGGNDTFSALDRTRGEVRGGAGRDWLVLDHMNRGGSWVDLARGRIGTTYGGDPRAFSREAGFENVRAVGFQTHDLLVGDGRANRLVGDGTANASWGNDTLIGGGGRDVAVGGKGRDRCIAEVRRGCER